MAGGRRGYRRRSRPAVELAAMLQPYVPDLIEDHRSEGRRLLLVATGPEPLAHALAGYLGFDGAVATRWESADGCYTGQVEGPVLWGRAKVEAVRTWAEGGRGIRTRATSMATATSTHPFWLPRAVRRGQPRRRSGHRTRTSTTGLSGTSTFPRACRKWQVGKYNRGSGLCSGPGWCPTPDSRSLAPSSFPRTGPAIVVFNHRSYFDPVAIGLTMARANRPYDSSARKRSSTLL